MRLNKKQLTKLSKIKSLNGNLITVDGISFVIGTLKNSDAIIKAGYYTDLPDGEIYLDQLKKVISRVQGANITKEGGKVNFQTDKVSLSINVSEVDSDEYSFETDGKVIGSFDTKMLKEYAKFCGKDALRPAMQGINFSERGVCATDAHTMRFDKNNTWENEEITVPHELTAILLEEEYEVVKLQGGDFLLKGDSQLISFQSLTENNKYPDWRGVMPSDEDFEHKIELESNSLQKELQFLKTIHVKVELFEGKLRCEDVDVGIDAEVDIEGRFDCPFKLGFNTGYLLKIAKECKGDIALHIDRANRAVMISDEYDRTFLIMPLRLDS